MQAHAVFLCIASDYHELGKRETSLKYFQRCFVVFSSTPSGNLGSFIDKQRAKKEPLDEQVSVC